MTPHGLVVAKALSIACASLLSYPGMGSLADLMNTQELEGRLHRAASFRAPYGKSILEKFGVEIEVEMLTRRQYFTDENFITTCNDLVAPLPPLGTKAWADELRARFRFEAVGCMVSHTAPHVSSARSNQVRLHSKIFGQDLPIAHLEEASKQNAKVVYAALGTMALSDRWDLDLGRQSAGNLPVGTTGKRFCQHVWKELLQAMELLGPGYFCVMCVGKQPDAMDFLGCDDDEIESKLPANVAVRNFVPQVKLLGKYTHVFLSHVGFNSLQESLVAGVPLIAIPQAMDQPTNARKVEAASWGKAFLSPMKTVCADSLAEAVRQVTDEGEGYRAAVHEARKQLEGGAESVAERLVELATAGSCADACQVAMGGC
eukprot:TRINITY_DN23417_c0_g1_i1.p1 TRINITY_DN23417_c0_g1~~TRINITY_DN23417_c0_g1_i1.p1  ORF type:complete len:373 (+),score=61.15 TRINITY_DN23417_c0_g1_i1:477-1595(+)